MLKQYILPQLVSIVADYATEIKCLTRNDTTDKVSLDKLSIPFSGYDSCYMSKDEFLYITMDKLPNLTTINTRTGEAFTDNFQLSGINNTSLTNTSFWMISQIGIR